MVLKKEKEIIRHVLNLLARLSLYLFNYYFTMSTPIIYSIKFQSSIWTRK